MRKVAEIIMCEYLELQFQRPLPPPPPTVVVVLLLLAAAIHVVDVTR